MFLVEVSPRSKSKRYADLSLHDTFTPLWQQHLQPRSARSCTRTSSADGTVTQSRVSIEGETICRSAWKSPIPPTTVVSAERRFHEISMQNYARWINFFKESRTFLRKVVFALSGESGLRIFEKFWKYFVISQNIQHPILICNFFYPNQFPKKFFFVL